MLGWKLIPDRAGHAEVCLTQLGQEVTIGSHDCDSAIEHTRVSSTHTVANAVGRAHEERHIRHVRAG